MKVIDINKNVDISSVEELFVFIDALYEIKEKTRSSEIQEKIEIGINIAQGNHLYLENIIESWQPRNKIDEVYKEYMRYRVPRIIEQLKENKTIQNIQGIKYII